MNSRKTSFSLSAALFLAVLFCSPLAAEASPDLLETLGVQIHTSLEGLRLRSRLLTEELERQSSEAVELRTTLSDLSSSLESTNRQLLDYETRLRDYEGKLRWHRKLAATVAALAFLFVAVRVVTLILRLKGIHLPEIINILA